jgi:hypothetical protein
MSELKVTFANIVATPTDTSWSQAYTAGKLYAVLSLEGEDTTAAQLAAMGKEVINALVEEFFTLETKDLASIKTAVINTTQKIPQNLQASLVVISLVNTILYAFSYGGGKVLLKRNGKIGTVLSPKKEITDTVQAVSGFLEHGDIAMLQTKQFAQAIASDAMDSFETPTEAVEILSPKIHGSDHGGASAIILSYLTEETATPLAFEKAFEPEEEKEPLPSPLEDEVTHTPHTQKRSFTFPKIPLSLPKLRVHIPKKAFLLLLIPLILIAVLGYSIYTTKKAQENTKIQQLFDKVYPQALKKYEEGQALQALNEQLAQDDFQQAKAILKKNEQAFPPSSEQEKKINDLLEKVNAVVTDTGTEATLQTVETDASNSPLLSALLKNTHASYATMAEDTVYLGSNTGVLTADGKTKIAAEGDWKSIGGIGAFGTNIYVLDKSGNQILKYLGGAKESKSVYASGSFGNAKAMAIDSSIYVLTSDGSIKKYTRGTADTFSVTGLEIPFKNPTRIVTNADTENVYVLDPGTARIVVLDKSGAFQTAYSVEVLKNAKDFEVNETDKKIYILANSKIFALTLP